MRNHKKSSLGGVRTVQKMLPGLGVKRAVNRLDYEENAEVLTWLLLAPMDSTTTRYDSFKKSMTNYNLVAKKAAKELKFAVTYANVLSLLIRNNLHYLAKPASASKPATDVVATGHKPLKDLRCPSSLLQSQQTPQAVPFFQRMTDVEQVVGALVDQVSALSREWGLPQHPGLTEFLAKGQAAKTQPVTA